ncbi:immediate early response 2b [Anoplopoma fimbria]|uniref:immediate early response 2b n=1 Tax=Anoplopoma fimbria TaxID=229290 RepID=UPI0023EC1F01|nr:immediate early response 2b [Anoplopoma fimbria]
MSSTAMEVNAEARRILAVSISKLYSSRTQRGGLRLHRSLLLSMVMRSARDIYHSSREMEDTTPEEPMETVSIPEEEQPNPSEESDSDEGVSTEDKENLSPTKQSRKRRGKASAAPDFLPSKRARLEPGEERHAGQASCRAGVGESLSVLSLNRVIPAF